MEFPLDAKTCPSLIPEWSGFIPSEDLPSFWALQWLALFQRYENREWAAVPRKEKFSAFAKFVQHWLKMFNIKKKKSLFYMLESMILSWGGMFLGFRNTVFLIFVFSSSNHIMQPYYATIQSRTLSKLTKFEL